MICNFATRHFIAHSRLIQRKYEHIDGSKRAGFILSVISKEKKSHCGARPLPGCEPRKDNRDSLTVEVRTVVNRDRRRRRPRSHNPNGNNKDVNI